MIEFDTRKRINLKEIKQIIDNINIENMDFDLIINDFSIKINSIK